jgi:Cof subfamily protein (haloacid dehalogenase superfamily)
MKHKVICSDIDGTLLNKDRQLSVKTIAEVKRVKNDVPVILISSRMPKSMALLQDELDIADHPMIAYNGSLIIDKGAVIHSIEIAPKLLNTIKTYCEQTDIHLSLYNNDDWVVPKMDYWANREANNTRIQPQVQNLDSTHRDWSEKNKGCHKIMCMGDENEIGILYDTLAENHSHELNIYRSKPTYIEISDIKQDKASALEMLLEKRYPNYKMADVVAFGDNYNDLSLIQKVGHGVAVQNAKQEVLNSANEITKSNIDDGVALSIAKNF